MANAAIVLLAVWAFVARSAAWARRRLKGESEEKPDDNFDDFEGA